MPQKFNGKGMAECIALYLEFDGTHSVMDLMNLTTVRRPKVNMRWVQRSIKESLDPVNLPQKRGRKRKTTDQQDRRLVRYVNFLGLVVLKSPLHALGTSCPI